MIVTTTPSVEGQKISQYHGIVVGEAILGANVFKDIFAGITDILGGRSNGNECGLEQNGKIAPREPTLDTAMEAQSLVAISLEGSVG